MAIPVVWSSVLFGRSGLAEESRNQILALAEAGITVHACPLSRPWGTDLSTETADQLAGLIPLSLPERFVHVMHVAPPDFERHPRAVAHVGRAMVETETAPAEWANACSVADEVWTPSTFALEAFARAGVPREKLFVVQECLDAELYGGEIQALDLEPLGISGFVFLCVAGWSLRKGWDVLVRAYVEEFDRDDDVTLLFKASPYFGRSVPDATVQLRRFLEDELGRDPALSPRIVVADLPLGQEAMVALYRAAGAYVMPSRGEGWGRPYMEAMAAGTPTIGTRWGGNLEFMNDDNAYLVDCEVADVSAAARGENPFRRGARWAEPSATHLRALMRRVLERRDEAATKAVRARRDVLDRCSRAQAGAVMCARLEALEVRALAAPDAR